MKNINLITNRFFFKKGNILLIFFLISYFLNRLNSSIYFIDLFGQISIQILFIGVVLFFILLRQKKLISSFISGLICVLLALQILLPCKLCHEYFDNKLQNYKKIRLMSFNVRYNNQFHDFDNFVDLILNEKPDIIQFQEVSSLVQEKIKSIESFYPYTLGLNTPFLIEANVKPSYIRNYIDSIMDQNNKTNVITDIEEMRVGNIILSKYPLKNNRVIDSNLVLTNIVFGNTELTLIGVHLYPPESQYYFKLTIDQMKYLKNFLKKSKQNTILIGDLNMVSTSKRFTNFLKDTNLFTNTSITNSIFTWPAFLPNYLGIQIDHVLFSKNFKMISKKTTKSFGSDHRPLIVDLAFNKEN